MTNTDRTPIVATMKDTRANRGELEAISRFGAPAEKQAARIKLREWHREDERIERERREKREDERERERLRQLQQGTGGEAA